jgi:GntR family transcriptional regulator/MocR family aminotransferase
MTTSDGEHAGFLQALDPKGVEPFFRQVYARIREGIARGQLKPGDRLPSARALATGLGVARGTVDAAYAMLVGEGYVATRGAAGTVVTPGLKPPPAPAPDPVPRRIARGDATEFELISAVWPFQMGLPAFDAFPRKLWTRLAARRARDLGTAAMTYPDAIGYRPLREAVARYLAVARGIACSPDQVVITRGFQGAVGLLSRALLAPGDSVWLEDPGYFLVQRAMKAAGMRVVAVPVDGEGLDVAAGTRQAADARMAIVSPAHQAPLGVALALHRRLALLDWARAAKSWVVEDDYDSEFRYTGRPLPALKSLDRDGRVLYAGTFSKVLFPGLRLGYLVLPDGLERDIGALCAALHPGPTVLEQAVVTDFMAEGHFARHIRRMRGLYGERRRALATALAATCGDRFTIELQAGGMHLIARLADHESDRYLVRLAHTHELAPAPLSEFTIERDAGQALLLSFTNIPVEQAPTIVQRLERALRG